jgi:hypothetical protein
MRKHKHQMGVEGPSFHRFQQERHGEQPGAPPGPVKKRSIFEAIFHADPEQKAVGPMPEPPEAQLRPGYQRRGVSAVDAGKWFEVPLIWEAIVKNRPIFGGQKLILQALTRATNNDLTQSAGEVVQFFGIPISSFQGLTLDEVWLKVIGPFFEELERSLNQAKPFTIPGLVSFELNEVGQLTLVYKDR